jgi:hypothetical protein
LHEEQTLNKAKSDIPNRNSETNKFQNRRAEFRTKVKLNKKRVHRGDASSYVKCAIVTPPKKENNSNGHEKRND